MTAPALGFSPFHFDLGRAWHDLVVWHVDTFRYHYTLKAPHPFYSPPYSWPFLYKPVAYYSQNLELGVDQSTRLPLVAFIFDLGNPVIWWGSLAALVATAWLAARRSYPAAFILFGLGAAHEAQLDRGERDVLESGHVREQVELLEDEPHLS